MDKSQETLGQLVDKHSGKINTIRSLVVSRAGNLDLKKLETKGKEDALFYTPVDDLFYLRYVLSQKENSTDESLAQEILQSLEWRLRNIEQPKNSSSLLTKYFACAYTGDLPNGSPVSVFSLRDSDLTELLKTGDNLLDDYMKVEKEKLFKICDRRSREKNKLIKAVSVVDAKDISVYQFSTVAKVFKMINKNRDFKAHPQLQQSTVLVNAPSIANNFLIRRTMKKISVSSVEDFLEKYQARDAVPSFLGGTADEQWNLQRGVQSSSVPPRKSSKVIREGSEEEWKLKGGSEHIWNIPIEYPNSIVSFTCDTQTKKPVMVSAVLKDGFQAPDRITFAPILVNKQIITYPCGENVGTLIFKVENFTKNKLRSKLKRHLKKKTSLGKFSYRVEVPDDNIFDDSNSYFSSISNVSDEEEEKRVTNEPVAENKISALPQNDSRDLELDLKSSDKKVEVSNVSAISDSTDSSYSSYFRWLVPYVPEVVSGYIFGPEPTERKD